MGADPGTVVAAVVIASLGLWWFRYMLKDIRRLPRPTRFGVYALVWLAYFILVMILAGQTG